jgi:hypothetical protein
MFDSQPLITKLFDGVSMTLLCGIFLRLGGILSDNKTIKEDHKTLKVDVDDHGHRLTKLEGLKHGYSKLINS